MHLTDVALNQQNLNEIISKLSEDEVLLFIISRIDNISVYASLAGYSVPYNYLILL